MPISRIQTWGLALLLLGLTAGPLAAQFRLLDPAISYQGCLQDAGGNPVADGTYDLHFRIHLNDDTTVWEHDFDDVDVVGCVYDLLMGRFGNNPLPNGAVWDSDLYLEVTVEGTTLSPSTLFTGSPMAFGLVLPIEASTSHPDAILSIHNTQTSTSGTESPSGIYGSTAAHTGQIFTAPSYGVRGEATSSTGFSHGVSGASASHNGRGVFGYNSSPDMKDGVNNDVYPAGVYGWSVSPTGRGVHGRVNESPPDILIFGRSSAGVYGESTANTGRSHGVYGITGAGAGRAIYGVHTNGGYAGWFEGHAQIRSGNLEINNGFDESILLEADEAGSGAGAIKLYNGNDVVIELDASFNGDGRIITQEFQITGGSDLSENFDVSPSPTLPLPVPGMVVAIDPDHPGRLQLSATAYNPMVAGIISGAGGIETGLLMGQKGSIADGDHPVALAGRVYVYADADAHPIRPGDLMTTASRPGHAMKATDSGRAPGTILGKAMTGLDAGQGLVLVLVSLQ